MNKCNVCNTILPDELRLERHMNVHRRNRRKERASNEENLSIDNIQWPDVSVLAAVNAQLNQIR
jgi:hypothetical protein